MKYAIKYPNHISRLLLSNSISPKAGEFETETNQRLKSRMSADDSIRRKTILASLAFKEGDVEAYAQVLKLSFKSSFYNIRHFEQLHIELPPDYLAKRKLLFFMAKELSVYDLYPSLNKISCPTLIIHGAYDGMPDDLPKKIKAYIPDSELVFIKKAGHFPFIERKKTFNTIIYRFLAEH